MINQIKPTISNNPNVFAPFINKDGVNYAISKPFNAESTKEVKKHNEAEKEKKSNALGYSIAMTSLVAGFGVLALMKGLPKGSYLKIDKFFKFLEEKTEKIAENKHLSFIQTLYLTALKGVKSLTNKSKGIFNTGSLKDVFLKRTSAKTPGVRKFVPWITNVFEKISIKTSKRAYVKTAGKFDDMAANFAECNKRIMAQNPSEIVTIEGVSKTVKEWVAEAEKKTKNIQNNFEKGFKEEARRARLTEVKQDFEGLDDKMWADTFGDLKGFIKDKKSYQTFLAEESAAPTKIKLTQKVNTLRGKITNDIDDNYLATKKILSGIDSFIDPTDKSSRVLIKNITKNLEEYKIISGADEVAQRIVLTKSMAKNLKQLELNIKAANIAKPNSYDPKTVEQVSTYIKDLGQTLTTNKKGEVQEVLTIYKNLLGSKAEYTGLKKETYKAIKSLDKSIDLETDKLFDKLRDLKIGSAPTDVLGVLTSMGVIGFGLTKADNKDERTSVALKYGIPALGAIVTSLYCTVGLVSGGASLVLGLVSGIAINKVGEAIDKSRKKYNENPIVLPSLPSLDLSKMSFDSKKKV